MTSCRDLLLYSKTCWLGSPTATPHAPSLRSGTLSHKGEGIRSTPQTKSPVLRPGFSNSIGETGLRGFVRDSLIVSVDIGFGLTVCFAIRFGVGLGLGRTTARALGKLALDFLDRFGLGHMLDD